MHQNAPDRTPESVHPLLSIVPPREQPEIGLEGLPIMSHYIHMLDVTIMSAGQKTQLPCWRGKLSQVDAFVLVATVSE